MTINELIRQLQNMDEDIKEYQIHIRGNIVINEAVAIKIRGKIIRVPENVDVDNRRLYLIIIGE